MKFELPKINMNWETGVTALVLLLFGVWGFKKCSDRKATIRTQYENLPVDQVTQSPSARVIPNSAPSSPQVIPRDSAPFNNTPTQYSNTTARPPRTPAEVPMNAPPLSAAPTAPAPASPDLVGKGTRTSAPAVSEVATFGGSRLYVLRKGLKLRKDPELNARVLGKLKKYDEVYFLDEATREKTAVRLEDGTLVEKPWFKVRTKRGTIGWVHGSGVDFYKRDAKGH